MATLDDLFSNLHRLVKLINGYDNLLNEKVEDQAYLQSIKSIIKDHKKEAIEFIIEDYGKEVRDLINESLTLSSLKTNSIIVISPRILDAYTDGIKDSIKRFEESIRDITLTPQQKKQEAKIAKATICAALQLIKDHNKGELPPFDDINNAWDSYKCDNL